MMINMREMSINVPNYPSLFEDEKILVIRFFLYIKEMDGSIRSM